MYNPKQLFFTNAKQLSIFWGFCLAFLVLQIIVHTGGQIGDSGEVLFEVPIDEYAVPELVFRSHRTEQIGLKVGTSDSTHVIFSREDAIWAALQDSLDGWVLGFTDNNRYVLANP